MKRTAWLHGLITAENNARKDGKMDNPFPKNITLDDTREYVKGSIAYDLNNLERLKLESVEHGNS